MSLRWRIALALAVIAALASSGAAVGSYVTTSQQLDQEIDDSLLVMADRVNSTEERGRDAARYSGGPGPGGGGLDGRALDSRDGLNAAPVGGPADGLFDDRGRRCPTAAVQPSAAAQLVRADGVVVPCYVDGLVLPVDDADLKMAGKGGPPRLRDVTVEGRQYRMISLSWYHGGLVQAARGLTEAGAVLSGLRWRLAALVALAVLSAAVCGWWFAGRMVRPVERLRAAAERIAATGDLTTAVPAAGPGEVGSLAASFTTMMAGLATSREQQQRLISDASHELRTPLTSLRTNIELLERAERLPEGQRGELLADVKAELNELTDLVTELVELATDRSSPAELFEPVRLAEVADAVAKRAARRSGRAIEVLAGATEGTWATDLDGSDSVNGVRPLLERAVSNLVENALKYSPPTTSVRVVVSGTGRGIEVRDEGDGIDPADLPHVFERFYRSTGARTSPGSGLGLAIVQQIVERHGGRVWARNNPAGGASVGFELG